MTPKDRSPLKPSPPESELRRFLTNKYSPNLTALHPLPGGETSQAYAFQSGARRLVLRLNHTDTSFRLDRYMANALSGSTVPVPAILEIGSFSKDYCFAISEQAEGQPLDQYPQTEFLKILPNYLSVLRSLHTYPTADTRGFGNIDPSGAAPFPTWKDYLQQGFRDGRYLRPNLPDGYESDRAFFDHTVSLMQRLIDACPEERTWVHGDCSLDNVIGKADRVTALLDWGCARLGDWVFDAAWLDFWTPPFQLGQAILENAKNSPLNITDYGARLKCYQILDANESIGHFCRRGEINKYVWVRDRLKEILEEGTV